MFRHDGLIQIYTGNGKGKTTAAIGQALRAAGQGAKVGIVFFMKGSKKYGEFEALDHIPNISTSWAGRHYCINFGDETDVDYSEARRGIQRAKEYIKMDYDMLILDEISIVLLHHLIAQKEIEEILTTKPKKMEIILTGIQMPERLITLSDLVTEMKNIKHPYQKGITARKGIEF
ncbi:MAG: cob(I)yrinic acid a,c-diamide adenosyltransferase [Synergistaceae bacterium]